MPLWAKRLLKYAGLCASILFLLACVALIGFRLAAAMRETATAAELAPGTGRLAPTQLGGVFIQEAGPPQGLAVVFTHGTAAWSELWRETMNVLAQNGYHAIAVDLPPFGFSERGLNNAFTRADQAERLKGVLDGLKVDRAVIVGQSFGSGPAVEMAMRYPDRVQGLVLLDPALGLPEPGEKTAADPPGWLTAILGVGPLRNAIVAITITNRLMTRTLLARLMAKRERATDSVVSVLQTPMRLKNSTEDFGAWLQYFVAPDRDARSMEPENYRKIAMPVSLIWGDKDEITPLQQGQRLKGLIPGSTLTIIEGSGHMPHIEDTQAFEAALLSALAQMKDRGVASEARTPVNAH